MHNYAYGGTPGYALSRDLLYATGTGDPTYSSYRGFQTVSTYAGDPGPAIPVSDLRLGYFDNDNKIDVFTSTAAGQWMYSSGGTGPWENLRSVPGLALADLRLGDFNGDGTTDVFTRESTGQWKYSPSGTEAWVNLSSSGYAYADLRFGDFNADGTTDVFTKNGSQWIYVSAGLGSWINLSTSSAALTDLAFADVAGDARTDVFVKQNPTNWSYATGGTGNWITLNTSAPATVVADLRFADVDGDVDGKAEVIEQTPTGGWRYWSVADALWTNFTGPGDVPLADVLFGDFDGDGKADAFTTDANGQWKFSSGGDQPWALLRGPGVLTSTNSYYRGLPDSRLSSLHDDGTLLTDKPELQGRIASTRTTVGDGTSVPEVIASSETTYEVSPTLAVPFTWRNLPVTAEHNPHVVQATETVSRSIDDDHSVTSTTLTDFDAALYVPTQVTTTVSDGTPANDETQCSSTSYVTATSPYLVLPSETKAYDGPCTGAYTSRSEVWYDSAPPAGDWSTGNAPTQGLPTGERTYTSQTAFTESRAAYDETTGRILKAWLPSAVASYPVDPSMSWSYGADAGLWTTTVTRPIGVDDADVTVATTWTERARGNVVKQKGANAADWTHYQYDALGLLTTGWAPAQWGKPDTPTAAENPPTALFVYNVDAAGPTIRATPVVVTSAQFVKASGTDYSGIAGAQQVRRSYTFLDGWGRTLEQHTPVVDQTVPSEPDVGRTIVATHYNALGQNDWTSAPFFDTTEAQVASGLKKPTLASLPSATQTEFDSRGRAISQSLVSDGVIVVSGPDETPATTTTSYDGPMTTVTSPIGDITRSVTDVLGRMVKQEQGHVISEAFVADVTTEYAYATLPDTDMGHEGFSQVTVYDSEAPLVAGAPERTIDLTSPDLAHHATVFVSNLAGQRKWMIDPNAGRTDFGYDDDGYQTTIESEAGVTNLGYDDLGRMISRETTTLASVASSEATWEYVDAGEVGAIGAQSAWSDFGMLRSSTSTTVAMGQSFTTTTEATYDAFHRPLTSKVTLPETPLLGDLSHQSYETSTAYDNRISVADGLGFGQVVATTMPAIAGLPAETASVGYRLSGQAQTLTLTSAGSSTNLVTAVTMDGTGQLLTRSYGNGVDRAITYDPVRRVLTDLTASFDADGSGPGVVRTVVQWDQLSRDEAGRVSQISDETSVAGSVGCFAYDGLNRLAAAWTETATACGDVAPLSSGSTFDDSATALDAEWSYSATGKILSVVNGAANPVTDAFTYTDVSHPSAVTGVSHTGGLQDAYVYDAAGRMTQRTVGAASPETPEVTGFTWDVSSNLVESNGAGGHRVYFYDVSGQRVAQVRLDDVGTPEPEGTATAYFGATEATDLDTAAAVTGDVTGTRFYTFGGATVAVREASPGVSDELSLVLGDFQGSSEVMMPLHTDGTGALVYASALDAAAALVSRNFYTPYGATRGTDNLSIDHGWLNQVTDESSTGLVYLNARYYDPNLSRFLSPDPHMNPEDPRTLDPYRYADNNPDLVHRREWPQSELRRDVGTEGTSGRLLAQLRRFAIWNVGIDEGLSRTTTCRDAYEALRQYSQLVAIQAQDAHDKNDIFGAKAPTGTGRRNPRRWGGGLSRPGPAMPACEAATVGAFTIAHTAEYGSPTGSSGRTPLSSCSPRWGSTLPPEECPAPADVRPRPGPVSRTLDSSTRRESRIQGSWIRAPGR